MNLIEVNDNNSDELLASDDRIKVVKVHATWCGPCKVVAPKFQMVSEERKDADFFSVDADKAPRLVAKLGIRGVPTVLFIKNRTTINTIGASALITEQNLNKILDQLKSE